METSLPDQLRFFLTVFLTLFLVDFLADFFTLFLADFVAVTFLAAAFFTDFFAVARGFTAFLTDFFAVFLTALRTDALAGAAALLRLLTTLFLLVLAAFFLACFLTVFFRFAGAPLNAESQPSEYFSFVPTRRIVIVSIASG